MSIKLQSNRTILLAFGSAILVLIAVGLFSYRGVVESRSSAGLVEHTRDVLREFRQLSLAVETMSSSLRGYIISGDETYLEAMRTAEAAMNRERTVVRDMTKDNPEQQRRIAALDVLVVEWEQLSDRIVAMRRDSGLEATIVAFQDARGELINKSFQALRAEMIAAEISLLSVRSLEKEQDVEQTKLILIAGTLLGLLITGGAGWSVQRDSASRARTELALRESEDKFRRLIDGVRDHAIYMIGPLGEIRSWNPGAETITGWTFAEVSGQNYSRFFTADDIENGRPAELLRRAAANGHYEDRGTRVRKNGEQFAAQATLTASHDAEGKLRGFTVISRDLSEGKESEARYRGLMEAAPDAMVVVNQSGEIVLLNVQAEKQFGYHRDALLGQKVTSIIPQGFAERLIADDLRSAEDALAQQIGTGIELTALRKDGTEFPIEIMLSPLASAEGILVTAAIRDISVRNAAEKHLAQMEERYRGLLEAAPDAMVVVNQGGEIVLLNVQAENQFGYRRDELLGQMVTNIIPVGFAERLVADDLRSEEDALAQQIGTGIELIALRKDGSEFPIEIMLSPLDSAEGTLVTAAIRNISVRKAADQHMAQMEERYRGLLEAAPDAMVVVNDAGEIVLLNLQAGKQFGYRRDELLGQKVKNIIPEGFEERLIADDLRSEEDALAQQIGTGIELIARRKDGSEFPIELMLSPLENVEGTLVTAAIRNITARKQAAEQLLKKVDELYRSNEELGQFANIASHDLQEPLRMVASYTQLLSRRYKGKLDSDADEFIAFAVDGASRMQRLIQDLLTYSRVGTKGTEMVETSSEEAFQQAIMQLQGAITESGALVTHEPLPMVMADETQLTQLFQNLVGNAIKYQAPGVPKVHVSATSNGDKKWKFVVKDNGLGIDAQYFERIFGMFQRLHKREEYAGTGIGLAICKKIVERHGGSISVESQLGHGSAFGFDLASVSRDT
ncbi:MAG: PAS domain S-box protein [Pseudolabrys sp.]|nr:PAS domain S-box protein [Pseudolabrys sp.]